jgi:hypothetical protein
LCSEQLGQLLRGPAGEDQGGGDLIGHVPGQVRVVPLAGLRPPPGRQGGEGGGLPGRGPRPQPLTRAQHPDQLRLPQLPVPPGGRVGHEPGELRPRLENVEFPARREPGRVLPVGSVVEEPGRERFPVPGPRPRIVVGVAGDVRPPFIRVKVVRAERVVGRGQVRIGRGCGIGSGRRGSAATPLVRSLVHLPGPEVSSFRS